MTEAVPDHIAALVAFLRADAGVAAIVSDRVAGDELPDPKKIAWVRSMPMQAIVVRSAGGGLIGSAYELYGDQRVDVRCYGATPRAANDLWRVVYPALKQLRRVVFAECLLHWAKRSGGPMPLRDPATDWPLIFSSWQVLVAEVAAA